MEQVKADIKRLDDHVKIIGGDISGLTKSINNFAINVERLTQLLESHKDLTIIQFKTLEKSMTNMSEAVQKNAQSITLLNAEMNKARGAITAIQLVAIPSIAFVGAGVFWLAKTLKGIL